MPTLQALRSEPHLSEHSRHTHPAHHPHHGRQPCACANWPIQAFHQRIMADISRRTLIGGAAAMVAPFVGFRASKAIGEQPEAPDRPILFTNLRLFDGLSGTVREGVSILVDGNAVSALPGAGETVDDAELIDCGGRLAMPGLIDAHWHTTLCAMLAPELLSADVAYVHLVAAREAERTLMRGFTAVRDTGGPSFALKRAIDQGIVNGPRIYPSGAMISQTAGHADFRFRFDVPRGETTPLGAAELMGVGVVADGEAEVLRRTREQLMLGASQIKLTAGGGVSSLYDPIDVTQYREDELRAAVEAAEDWGTYVCVHVYTPRGIQRSIRAGVKSIEHGQLADEESAQMMAGEGIWWSLQPFLLDEDSNEKPLPEQRAAQALIAEGTARAYGFAKDLGIQTAWGTDIIASPQNLPNHARQLAKLTRFYDPLELLGIATAKNGELLRLAGPRNPYGGDLGVIAPGALADILIADGDPTVDLDFLMDSENLRIIMKDGRIYKDTL